MRPLCDEFLLDHFRTPQRHRKNSAVQAAVGVTILNRQAVQLFAGIEESNTHAEARAAVTR